MTSMALAAMGRPAAVASDYRPHVFGEDVRGRVPFSSFCTFPRRDAHFPARDRLRINKGKKPCVSVNPVFSPICASIGFTDDPKSSLVLLFTLPPRTWLHVQYTFQLTTVVLSCIVYSTIQACIDFSAKCVFSAICAHGIHCKFVCWRFVPCFVFKISFSCHVAVYHGTHTRSCATLRHYWCIKKF